MLNQESGPLVDGDINTYNSKKSQTQSLAMKCADSLPNLSSNLVDCDLISSSQDVSTEAQAGALLSPQASGDMHKPSECYHNSASVSHESPHCNAGHFYRGGPSNTYNNRAEFSSKRSNRAAFNQLSGNMNRHVSSFSQQGNGASFGYSHHGNRLNRDSGVSDSRVVARRVSRSVTTDDVHGGSNHAIVDGKFVRILQRPLQFSARSVGQEGSADDGESDKSSPETLQHQQQLLKRAGHRKKTLSLNPEEREALENLVEEVIIGGLGEAIIDSDGTSSDDENCDFNGATQTELNCEHSVRTDVRRHRGRVFEFNKDNKLVDHKTVSRDNIACSELNYSSKGEGKFPSRITGNGRVRESNNTCAGAKFKEKKRGDLNTQTKDGSPEGEKEKPNAATVRGVNIYPAQLKVAIKHMDSLPPRFLRRLQTGSNRTSGNESIIARLTMKSPTAVHVVADDASCSSSPTDRDRGRSKQTQLKETKKTIRNLLCDLDQYTDETVMMKDDCSHHGHSVENSGDDNLVFSAAQYAGYTDSVNTLLSTQVSRPQNSFFVGQHALDLQFDNHIQGILGVQPQPMPQICEQSLRRFNGLSQIPQMISCEELERELLLGSFKDSSIAHAVVEVIPMNKTACAQLPTLNQVYQNPLSHTDDGFPSYDTQQEQSSGAPVIQSAPVLEKKTQFSVDAPEFVSSFFVVNRQMTQGVAEILSNDPFYSANTADVSVQLTENIHVPMKPPLQQYPMVMVSSAGLALSSSSGATEYVELSTCSSVVPSAPYQMISYDQMNSSSLGMMRNAQSFIVPMSMPLAPPSAACSTEVVSPPVIDMNVMPYPHYQFVPSSPGYGAGYLQVSDFQNPTSEYNQPPPFMTAPMCSVDGISQQWLTDSSGSQQQWYNGYTNMSFENSSTYGSPTPTSFDESVYGGGPVMSGYQAQQMRNPVINANSWTYKSITPYEMSHHKVAQLLSKGANVMVIWIGGEGNKSSLMSIFPSNGTGPAMLNISNDLNSSNVREWNIKQVMDALENRRNPVIVDHTYEQSWEMESYSKLAEIHGYHVEVIDSAGTSVRSSVDNSQKSIVGNELCHGIVDSYQRKSIVSSGDQC